MALGLDPQLGIASEIFFEVADDCCCVVEHLEGAPGKLRLVRTNASFRQFEPLARAFRHMESGLEGEPFWAALLESAAGSSGAVRACMALGSHWVEVQSFALPGTGRLGLRIRDITEHRRMVEKLIGLRRITTVGVISWGPGFALVDLNDGFMRMSGFSYEEAIGKTWQELTPAEHHPASWEAVRQVAASGEAVPYIKEYFRRDGSRWWGLFAPRKIGDEVIEFVLDVTQARAAEEALRISDRRKDEFLATLAHELRNPLAPIKNGMHILRLSTSAAASARTLDVIDRQINHLIRLVDDLLDVARITSGKVRLITGVVSIQEVLGRSLETVQAGLDAKQHRLSVELPAQPVLVSGDADRLTQVFFNLLSNAVKYTPPGGEIQLTADVQETQLTVSVIDTGVGIPAEQHAKVFELFSQVRGHQAHAEGGLGIGLALVDSLVRLHGGTVAVSSEGEGQGSTFRVTLPRAGLLPAQPSPGEHAGEWAAPACRVLVADDNEDAVETLANLLAAAGHEVVTASNGQEAVTIALEFQPDVAFIDIGMPVMDGHEAARAIRADPRIAGIRLVALTGWGQPADRSNSYEAGFDLHLVKPLTPEGLRTALRVATDEASSEARRDLTTMPR